MGSDAHRWPARCITAILLWLGGISVVYASDVTPWAQDPVHTTKAAKIFSMSHGVGGNELSIAAVFPTKGNKGYWTLGFFYANAPVVEIAAVRLVPKGGGKSVVLLGSRDCSHGQCAGQRDGKTDRREVWMDVTPKDLVAMAGGYKRLDIYFRSANDPAGGDFRRFKFSLEMNFTNEFIKLNERISQARRDSFFARQSAKASAQHHAAGDKQRFRPDGALERKLARAGKSPDATIAALRLYRAASRQIEGLGECRKLSPLKGWSGPDKSAIESAKAIFEHHYGEARIQLSSMIVYELMRGAFVRDKSPDQAKYAAALLFQKIDRETRALIEMDIGISTSRAEKLDAWGKYCGRMVRQSRDTERFPPLAELAPREFTFMQAYRPGN